MSNSLRAIIEYVALRPEQATTVAIVGQQASTLTVTTGQLGRRTRKVLLLALAEILVDVAHRYRIIRFGVVHGSLHSHAVLEKK